MSSVMSLKNITPLTFEIICAEDSRLAELYADALDTHRRYPHVNFDSSPIWYRMFKPRIRELVGLECDNPQLASTQCYDVAYEAIHEALSCPAPHVTKSSDLLICKALVETVRMAPD